MAFRLSLTLSLSLAIFTTVLADRSALNTSRLAIPVLDSVSDTQLQMQLQMQSAQLALMGDRPDGCPPW